MVNRVSKTVYFDEVGDKNTRETLMLAKERADVLKINNIIVEKGNPVKMILRVAEDRNCDLIIKGIKGKGTLEDAHMGDTVGGVVRRSKIPILVIRKSKD